MQGLMRLACLGYLIFFTVLLLVADPLRLVGVRSDVPAFLRSLLPVAHLFGFWGLAVLGMAARWPAPRWAITILLVLYAGVTEIVQGFLPPRTAEWGDWLQDLAGIAVGVALCWIVALVAGALARPRRKTIGCSSLQASDNWEIARNAMVRPTARNESWWG